MLSQLETELSVFQSLSPASRLSRPDTEARYIKGVEALRSNDFYPKYPAYFDRIFSIHEFAAPPHYEVTAVGFIGIASHPYLAQQREYQASAEAYSLGNAATNDLAEHPVVLEICELAESDEYEEKEAAKSKSISYAVLFARYMLSKCRTSPEVDLHPDGEVSLTWRSSKGIINIAFGENGVATYAAYFPIHKETYKGRFGVPFAIPGDVVNIIDRIEE